MAKKKAKVGGRREGAGRKVGAEGMATVITASVPESLVTGLDEVAAAEGWGRSRAVTEAIRAFVKRKKR